MASINFNAAAVEPQADYSPVPAGIYAAIITQSDIVPTKWGTGTILELRWKIQEGNYAGRVIFDRINIQNDNPKAEEIGQRMLSTLCRAVGVMNLSETEQLHNRKVNIKVAIDKDPTGRYADKNQIRDYRAPDLAAQQTVATVTAAAPSQQAVVPPKSGAATPPWMAGVAA